MNRQKFKLQKKGKYLIWFLKIYYRVIKEIKMMIKIKILKILKTMTKIEILKILKILKTMTTKVETEDFEDDDDEEVEEVNFASTEFDDGEPNLPNINLDYSYTWIILWILQYQQQYKLPNVAIDSLFKFLRFFLLTIDENKFLSFPSSLYMAKKTLGISTNIIKYAACSKCHKLYDINEISNKTEVPT